MGQGLLIVEASRSHSGTPQSVRLLWKSDKPHKKTFTWEYTTLTRDKTPTPLAGFEPAIPASERPHTHALEHAATGIGWEYNVPKYEFLLTDLQYTIALSSQSPSSFNKPKGHVPQVKLQHNLHTHQRRSFSKFVSKWQLPYKSLSTRHPRPPANDLDDDYPQ
jgi:hypothetical protein